ncbi:MAG: hypothetical protein SNJ54_08025 [Anaerolineae bacterium]
MKALILANTAATFVMIGVIWVMQIVHYPLFANVGTAEYPTYQMAHMVRISAVVMPVMLIEAVTAFALALTPPSGVPPLVLWIGLGLVVFIWGSTFIFQDAQHGALARGFNAEVHAALVSSNWLRTIAWSLRGVLMLGVVSAWMQAPAP